MTDQERLALYAQLLLERFDPANTRPPDPPADTPRQQSARRARLLAALAPRSGDEDQ